MATQVSAAIAKILQDGEWHSTMYFVASCGYIIHPQISWRKGVTEKSGKHFSYGNPNLSHIATKREIAKYKKDNKFLTDREITKFQQEPEFSSCTNLGKTKIIRDILRGWYKRDHVHRKGRLSEERRMAAKRWRLVKALLGEGGVTRSCRHRS